MKFFVVVLLLGALGAAGWVSMDEAQAKTEAVADSSLFKARREGMDISVTENGYLKAMNSLKLSPEFERSGTITWLIEEGTAVEEGDILVEFDKSDLEGQVTDIKNKLIQYEMEHEAGSAELGIQERDNETFVEKAELALEMAELTMERYVKGEAPNELRKKLLAKEKADSEYQRAVDRYKQVPELTKEGFMTAVQEEEERIRLREAEINRENVTRELELYQTYTTRMDLTKHKTSVKDATRELANATIKADINLKQKKARVTQQERRVQSTKLRVEQLDEEVGHMTLKATQPGLVHYGDPDRPWRRGEVKIGGSMYRGNTVITLPDLSVMQVSMRVHEADIDMVEMDMEVVVSIDTHKGVLFSAKVTKIASVASGGGDSTGKTFSVEVTLDPFEVDLRAGVTARAEIMVAKLGEVLQIPIHAVHAEGDEHFCFIYANGEVSRRVVEVGRNNAHRVEVTSGLEADEMVLLYDPRTTEEVKGGSEDTEESAAPMGAGMGGEE